MTPPKVLPPHYFFLTLITMSALGYFSEQSLLPGMWYLIGIAPFTLGLIFAGVAVRQFSKAETNIVPLTESTTLVTSGMFTFSRNPMYLSFTVANLGIALIVNAAWPIIFLPATIAIMHYGVISREERYVERLFGEEYLRYKARVRRWI